MSLYRAFLYCIWMGLLMVAFQSGLVARDNIRLAIFTGKEVMNVGDLLLSELSTKDPLVLVERSEIEKVLAEQKIVASGLDSKAFVQVGQILGADGLITLELKRESTNALLITRLLAVKQGVVLDTFETPWPLQASAEWPQGVFSRFAPLFAKLTVLSKDAVPISILSFRSAAKSSEAVEMERGLTLLLIDRITRERELFVLERRKMDSLALEKEFSRDESPFWNGSLLLDGILDRDGYSKEKITVHARLLPAGGGEPVLLEAAGSRANPSEVIELLAQRIVQALKRKSSYVAGNNMEEAARFFEEAQWAYKWRIFSDAAVAAETSWVLGKRDRELAELRIRCYQQLGYDPANGWYDLDRQLVSYSAPPDLEKFEFISRAMELYCHDFRSYMATNSQSDWAWYSLGVDLLNSGSYWLRHFYFTPEARIGQEEKIEKVQGLAREMSELISRHGEFTNQQQTRSIVSSKAYSGVYWVRTPEEGVQIYRQLERDGRLSQVRSRFLEWAYINAGSRDTPNTNPFQRRSISGGSFYWQMELSNPYLTGWKWNDRKRVKEVWCQFIDELCSSTNAFTRLEGLFLRTANSPTDQAYETNFQELMVFIGDKRQALFDAKLDEQLIKDIDDLTKAKERENYNPTPFRIRRETWKQAHEEWLKFRQGASRTARFEEIKQYVTTGKIEYVEISKMSQFDFSEAEARILLPLVRTTVSNLTVRIDGFEREKAEARKNTALPVPERHKLFAESHSKGFKTETERRHLSGFENFLAGKLAMPTLNMPNVTNQVTTTNVQPSVSTHPVTNSAATRTAVKPQGKGIVSLTNVLKVDRFWRFPVRPPGAFYRYPSEMEVIAFAFRNGRLWVESRYDDLSGYSDQESYHKRGVIFSIDVDTFESTEIVLDPKAFKLSGWDQFNPRAIGFEVHKDLLYVGSAGAVKRYSLSERKWSESTLPDPGIPLISAIKDRLFLSPGGSIFEMSLEGGDVAILASNRRRPPATILDSLQTFDRARLVEGAEDAIVAFVSEKLYRKSGALKDWTLVDSVEPNHFTRCIVSDAGFLLTQTTPNKEYRLFALRKGTEEPELLFAHSIQEFPNHGAHRPIAAAPLVRGIRPKWRLPHSGVISSPICMEEDAIWSLTGTFRLAPAAGDSFTLPDQNGRNATLYYLESAYEEPLIIPLSVQFPGDRLSKNRLREIHSLGFGPLIFAPTPVGLVFTGHNIPGFWFISKAELLSHIEPWRVVQKRKKQETNAAMQTKRKEFLQKADTNRNGNIDPEEKARVIGDRLFLDLELDVIDANANGKLDPVELVFFDVNANWRLERNEFKAMESCLEFLADEIIRNFDQDGDGRLAKAETGAPYQPARRSDFIFPGQYSPRNPANDNRTFGKEDVLDILRTELNSDLLQRRGPVMPMNRGSVASDVLERSIDIFWKTSAPAGSPATNSVNKKQ